MRCLLIGEWRHHRRGFIDIRDGEVEHIGYAQIARIRGRHAEVDCAHLGIVRHAAECPGGRIEIQPGRQWAAIGKRGVVGQDIAIHQVLIGKGICRCLDTEQLILRHGLIRQRTCQRGGIIHVLNRERKGVCYAQASAIRGVHRDGERAHIAIERRAIKRTGNRIKTEPRGQHSPVSQTRAQLQHIARILVGKRIRRHDEAERRIFPDGSVYHCIGHSRHMIDGG